MNWLTQPTTWPCTALVIFGGEALELETLRPWFDRHGDETPQLVNMYGITETTVHVTYRPIVAADLELASGTSPIRGADSRVADLPSCSTATGNPVPVGVVGEIHVGGHGLARGYLGRAAPDGRSVCGRPVFGRAGCPALSQRRPRSPPRRWVAGVCWPLRPSGHVDPRFSDRAPGRDRKRACS